VSSRGRLGFDDDEIKVKKSVTSSKT